MGEQKHFYTHLDILCDADATKLIQDLIQTLMQDPNGLPRGPWASDDAALAELDYSHRIQQKGAEYGV